MRIRLVPPPSTSTVIVRAPASREFLDELFDDGCRPLDDLAGRDLVDEVGRQNANGHWTPTEHAGARTLATDRV